MAEGGSDNSNVDDETLFKEEFAHVEELLISSREECIEIGTKFQDLSMKVESMMQLQDASSSDHSFSSDHLEQEKEVRNDYEEFKSKYESRISAYQQNSQHQARIVDDLQTRVQGLQCSPNKPTMGSISHHINKKKRKILLTAYCKY
ncbi:uncharacterized protein CDAR_226884 [Caerostris darwini]|uniref:Uncharacterized protein n=1 Tax=Caerostris darwini TaxID=1538125 RepID=A0AAV4UVR6_9ARAC|nr:uncharacterized protein CDAR_226884 [Caerostris darwini]